MDAIADLKLDEATGDLSVTANRSGVLHMSITSGTSSGPPVDLTGSTARLIAKKALKDTVAVIDWTSQFSHNGVGGVLTLTVTPTDTIALDDTLKEASITLVYQLIITLADGKRFTAYDANLILRKSLI